MINIMQKHIEGGDALGQPLLDLAPFSGSQNPGQEIKWENLFGAVFVTIHRKGHPLCQKGVVSRLLALGDFLGGGLLDALHQFGIMWSWLTSAVEHFVPSAIKLVVRK